MFMILFFCLMSFLSEYGIAMEVEEITIDSYKREITTLLFAQTISKHSSEDWNNYYLSPKVIAEAIKKKLLNDPTKVSPLELACITEIQKDPEKYQKLETSIFTLLSNKEPMTTLQEVRSQLFLHDLQIFTNAFEKLENIELRQEVYETYESNDLPIGWGCCLLVEFFAATIMTVIALHAC